MIVPIIETIDCKKEIVASAFIIDPGLIITAGHTFYDGNFRKLSMFDVKIGEITIPLQESMFDEYLMKGTNYAKNDDTYFDLFIFRVPEKFTFHSDLNLSDKIDFNEGIDLIGYSEGNIDPERKSGKIINHRESITNVGPGDCNMRCFKNCFQIDISGGKGMSGGPVLKGNDVFGMIVFGHPDTGTTAIKAEYILKVIKENGLN